MKIRLDFVTNSSSSSYIVAFKNGYDFDEETLKKYPFLKHYNGEMDRITNYLLNQDCCSDTSFDFEINTKEELDNFCIKYYCWDQPLEDWIKDNVDFYNKMKELIEKKYSIFKINIDYNDSYLYNEIDFLINSNDNRTILIEQLY